jgi:GntR family transcriptional regulator
MRINPAHSSPVFVQIADGLRAQVAAGVYRAGDIVPSIRELAVRLLVNPNTVKRAYDELEREGVLEARKGVGMFVREMTAEPAKARSADVVRESLTIGVRQGLAAGMDRASVNECYSWAWEKATARDVNGGAT